MASLLTSEKADVERIALLIEECKKMNIEVLPPDINESFRNFSVVPKENKIRFGLLAIKNVGENVVEAIVKEREKNGPFKSISDFLSRLSYKDLNKKSLESLIKAGVFDKLGERNQLLANLEKLLEFARESQKAKLNGQQGLFDSMPHLINNNLTLSEAKAATDKEKLIWEKELLGLFIGRHPLESYRKILEKKAIPISRVNSQAESLIKTPWFSLSRRPKIKIGGIISKIKKIITKQGKPMLFLKLEDLTDKIEVVVFPTLVEENPLVFQENKIVLVEGKIDLKDNIPKLICEQIEEIINPE
jgi:DNA polymerase-3 subunit alpha